MNGAQSNYFVLPALTLWWREMVRFFRQRDRVVGAMATPVVFWLLLGFGSVWGNRSRLRALRRDMAIWSTFLRARW